MSDPRLTDERLRSWLNGRQPDREGMCLQVLRLDRRYSDVQPRRPNGGPDGGRDLQATYRDHVVFGAVGFVNSASDAPAQRRRIRKKFEEDLETALKAKPDLAGFIFFTNVDLTPGERARLIEYARGKGIVHVDLYWRDLIRTVLDGPEGFGIRNQYLQLSMSDAEQAAFFSRFGNDLQDLITRQFSEVDRKVARLEFLQECQRPLTRLRLELDFKQPLKLTEFPAYRVLFVVQNFAAPGQPALCIAGRGDENSANHRRDIWLVHQGIESLLMSAFAAFAEPTARLELDPDLRAGSEFFPTLGSLNQKRTSLFCTRSLLGHVANVSLIANDYRLSSYPISETITIEVEPDPIIPMMTTLDLPPGEKWIELAPQWFKPATPIQNPILYIHRDWLPNFSSYVPFRTPMGDRMHVFSRAPWVRVEDR